MEPIQQQLADFAVMLVEMALPIVLAIVLKKLHSLANAAEEQYLANTSAKDRETIAEIVRMAVLAAEQSGLTLAARGLILDKKQAALDTAQAALAARGINVDTNELEAHIEATVLEALNSERLNTSTPANDNSSMGFKTKT